MPTGLVKSMIHASGAALVTCSAMSSTTGTVRSALARPPAPVVSCPTQPHSKRPGLVLVAGGLAADPELEQHRVHAVERGLEGRRRDQLSRVAQPREDPPPDARDQLEPLGRRVDEHQLVDGQHVPQPAEPVHELGCVRRPAADDRDLHSVHPLTPVSVTPSMKAFWARKKSAITGAITSRVAAMVRFQLVWWALLNVLSP